MKQPIGPLLPGLRQVVLAFNEAHVRSPRNGSGANSVTYAEQVQTPFLPKGLIIWGADETTLVHGVKVGNVTELEIGGYAPIPGRYFESGRTFEDIQRLADAGELELALESRQRLEMTEASPGVQVCVSISGSYDRFCLWGTTYAHGAPFRRASVEATERGTFIGRVDEVGLGGIRTVLDVAAPDASTAAELVIGLSRHPQLRY